ncbi:uncharacterized protein PG986_005202 [Apiospora aurea]|uniref:Uncharacterized protein n=1 Tax=Apiospora aurea TaxID=335848 RepID=A0ABR1QGX2_9PEZI
MPGFLVSPHYVPETPNASETNIVSITFGFCISLGFFTAAKAGQQSWDAYKRGKTFNEYIIIQFVLQIIINRIALLMVPATRARKVRWSVAAIVGSINISGFFIWIPARLQISPLYEKVNIIWDRSEKGVFLVVDLALNIYFIHLVRSRLVANGLTKYNRLFHFNVCMVVISVALDAVLIGATFLPSPVVYVLFPPITTLLGCSLGLTADMDLSSYLQFHPLTYLMKLYIEMNVASLIVKVVRDSSVDGHQTARGRHNKSQYYRTGAAHDGATTHNKMTTFITAGRTRHDIEAGLGTGDNGSVVENEGIRKTVETQIVRGKAEDDGVSETSSTTKVLRGPFLGD